MFDTPENRVITSGLTLASVAEVFLAGKSNKNAVKPNASLQLLMPLCDRVDRLEYPH
jgi:hypothetical protein